MPPRPEKQVHFCPTIRTMRSDTCQGTRTVTRLRDTNLYAQDRQPRGRAGRGTPPEKKALVVKWSLRSREKGVSRWIVERSRKTNSLRPFCGAGVAHHSPAGTGPRRRDVLRQGRASRGRGGGPNRLGVEPLPH